MGWTWPCCLLLARKGVSLHCQCIATFTTSQQGRQLSVSSRCFYQTGRLEHAPLTGSDPGCCCATCPRPFHRITLYRSVEVSSRSCYKYICVLSGRVCLRSCLSSLRHTRTYGRIHKHAHAHHYTRVSRNENDYSIQPHHGQFCMK